MELRTVYIASLRLAVAVFDQEEVLVVNPPCSGAGVANALEDCLFHSEILAWMGFACVDDALGKQGGADEHRPQY